MKIEKINSYSVVMNADQNALQRLPSAFKFQTMIFLSVMWTTVFCAAIGSWFVWDELVLGHLALVVGLAITTLTFRNADRSQH